MASIMAVSAAGSKHRTGDSSIAARSEGRGRSSALDRATPIWITGESTSTPSCRSRTFATAPAATVAETPAGELRLDVVLGHRQARGKPLHDHDERAAVRLACSEEPEHRTDRTGGACPARNVFGSGQAVAGLDEDDEAPERQRW